MTTSLSGLRWWWWSFLLIASLLSGQAAFAQVGNPLRHLLRADTARFGRVLRNPARYRVQILYTQINRDAQNQPHFRTYSYRVRPHELFLPGQHGEAAYCSAGP